MPINNSDDETAKQIEDAAKEVLKAAIRIAAERHCCLRCILEQLSKRTRQAVARGLLRHIGDEDDIVEAILLHVLQ